MKILVLNGPNINMLGIREPLIYGKETYSDLLSLIENHAKEIGIDVTFFQSNHEGDLIDAIQRAYFDKIDGIVFNPAGYTHTSIAIADAVKAVQIPVIEVHISDISTREAFRKTSYIKDVAYKTIMGEGLKGYISAIDILVKELKK